MVVEIGKKGMMYELAIGVATILILSLVWTLLMHPFGIIKNVFWNMTTAESYNQTQMRNQYDLAYNTMFYSLFIIAIVIFLWIIKISVKQQKSDLYG